MLAVGQAAKAQATDCGSGGDVVVYVDTSGSQICSYYDPCAVPPNPGSLCEALHAIVNNIDQSFLQLNPNLNIANPTYKFTVYVDDMFGNDLNVIEDPCLQTLVALDVLYGSAFEVKNINILRVNLPVPSCISTIGEIGTGCPAGSSQAEEWGRALARVSEYHPWRCNSCDSWKRIFIPMSDEGPRCGSGGGTFGCDMRSDDIDPNTPGVQLGTDREAVVLSSVCAVENRVYALPTLLACAGFGGGIHDDIGAPPEGVTPVCTCAGAIEPVFEPICLIPSGQNDFACVSSAGGLMALLTTGFSFLSTSFSEWQGTAVSTSIVFRVQNVTEFAIDDCDSIDFDNNGLFPDDNDLVAFIEVLAGGPCPTANCNDIDFNNDCLFPDDNDLIAFLRVLAGGPCNPD